MSATRRSTSTTATPTWPAPGAPPLAVAPGGLRPFAEVIKDARRSDGILTVWQKDDKVWLELKPDDFNRLDADFVRVIEDVIDTLITKNILNITDLPAEAQAKLFARKSFRERVSKSALRLFEPTDFGDVI